MINIWFCNAIVLSGAGYLNPLSSIDTMTSDENNHRCPCRAPGTLRNLQITLVDALTGGGTRTFTLRKNGADTAITIAMSGTGTTDGEDLTHTVTVAAGDELSIHQSTTFSPASTFAAVRMEFEADADGTSVYGAGGTNPQYDATTRYAPLLCGQVGRNDSSEPINAALACLDGTITDLDVRITAAPTSGKSRIFTILKNGVAQDGTGGTPNTTVTIANSATSGTASFSLTIAALDLLSLRCSSSGSPGNAGVLASSVFVSDSGEGQHITLTDDASLPTSGTQYNTAFGANLGWAASARLHAGAQTTLALQHIHAVVSIAPGVGKSWVFTLQKNDADTVLTTTISGTATENAFAGDDLVQINEGDTFRIKVDAVGTPASLSHAKVTFFPFTVETILGSAVFGTATTVTATLAIAMGLDGLTHIDDDPHTLTVYGDLHVTGDTILDGSVSGGGSGTTGPGSSTDHAIARWDGTGGDTLDDSIPTVEDDGRIANLTDPTGDQDATTKAFVEALFPSRCEGRLTLESGVPCSVTDQIGKSTIYFTPYLGNHVSLYSGSAWVDRAFTERSLALSGLTSGKQYDVFLYDNAGTPTLELSAAWTNDTTRADALTTQDAILVKSGAITRRYLGTIRTTGTTTTEDSHGGSTTQVGGKRFVWNLYNQLPRPLRVIDTTNTWTYTSSWRQANGASGNKVEFIVGTVIGYAEAVVHASIGLASNGTNAAKVGVGYDSTSTPAGMRQGAYNGNAGFIAASLGAMVNGPIPTIGYHYFAWLETGADGTTSLFYGDNNGDGIQSGLNAWITG